MFTVEGIIGAGKSTLCARLQEAGFVVAQEPIDKWHVGRHNLLDLYYKNPGKYAIYFSATFYRPFETTKGAPAGFASFQERSIDSSVVRQTTTLWDI